ncbi:hypothetical protein OIU34_02260 [Pararhizobium sp. BT-229]|uniref:hypothetical protein n=1 Tax=Pararhizobium sp. BT-229 TaxID=2986923 RepID=UPI0021F72398|nr:hypothetical protein [Pararhizobium sp. BT-229]MCV9960710.1 hypothetical protein [Pararhizobium sp. BT-229]
MEKLADLPPTALVTFGAVLAIIFGVRYLGLFQGQATSSEKASGSAQVAAVIVDPSALNRATAAMEAQTMEAVNHRKMLERATEDILEALQDLTRTITALREEMIRRGR